MRPVLVDWFCCEGGASMGYHRAGFDVHGVDLFDKFTRARYPFPAVTGDAILAMTRVLAGEALEFDNGRTLSLDDIAAWGASPPCQFYSITRHSHSNEHPDLLAPVRWLARQAGIPYVIENVPGAPLENPLTLCGTEFNLTANDSDGRPLHLKRHRLFESNLFLYGNGGCQCAAFKRRGCGVGGAYGGGSVDRAHAKEVRRGGYTPPKPVRESLLGIDWMTQNGLSQSIPPAYTQHIGEQLMAHVAAGVAA